MRVRFVNYGGILLLLLASIIAAMITAASYDRYDDRADNLKCLSRVAKGLSAEICAPDAGSISDKDERWIWLGLALFAGALTALLGIWLLKRIWKLDQPMARPGERGSGATVLASAALFISFGAIATVIVYVLPIEGRNFNQLRSYLAVIAGVAAAVLIALVNIALKRDVASAQLGQSRVYDELRQRWGAIEARMKVLCSSSALAGLDEADRARLEAHAICGAAEVDREQLEAALAQEDDSDGRYRSDPGGRWITGTGYMELWNRVHNAEEALLVVSSQQHVIAAGLFDETRLVGSTIENRDSLLDRLRRAIWTLGGGKYLSHDLQLLLAQIPVKCDASIEIAQARLVIRDVRHAVNQFRDKSREALIRARNQLMWTGMLTGVAAFSILLLAVLAGAPQRTILAATVFFLCGAVVGLFAQLRAAGEAISPEEDFGLARARLVYTPYISGLAAVGGVLVTAMLYATVNGSALKYQPPTPAPTIPAVAETIPSDTATTTATEQSDITPTVDPQITIEGDAADAAAESDGSEAATGDDATPTPTPTLSPPAPTATIAAASDDAGESQVLEAARVQLEPPPLALVFDLDENRFGLVIAAIFGLTPSLLISRLQGEANRYQADLRSSSGQDRRTLPN